MKPKTFCIFLIKAWPYASRFTILSLGCSSSWDACFGLTWHWGIFRLEIVGSKCCITYSTGKRNFTFIRSNVLEMLNITMKMCTTLNTATPDEGQPHNCVAIVTEVCSLQFDLQESPLQNADLEDGSASPELLPVNSFAQELYLFQFGYVRHVRKKHWISVNHERKKKENLYCHYMLSILQNVSSALIPWGSSEQHSLVIWPHKSNPRSLVVLLLQKPRQCELILKSDQPCVVNLPLLKMF